MKLWIGAEMSADVADSFRVVRLRVESIVNGVIVPKSYDLPLNRWDCIAIVRDDACFAERVRYSPKRRDMDFRLRIDHAEFKAADLENFLARVLESVDPGYALFRHMPLPIAPRVRR